MKITYIHHSAFCVEIEDKVLVFDYYNGTSVEACLYHGKMPRYDGNQEIYVFSSHSHRDHFDYEVLAWSKIYPNIHYIFAKDIRRKLGNSMLRRLQAPEDIRERICYVKPNEVHRIGSIRVETLLSTDQGVAYLVTCAGKVIYHAGDLNWWHWEGESMLDNQYQEATYQAQIDRLSDRKIDVAFVVLDPRQGADMYRGIQYFMEHVKARRVIPMHMWKHYEYIGKYKKTIPEEWADRIEEIKEENQVL